ncbi:MAG: DUF3899 domain-containing protein [Culicoidibacterales bacterium]
MKKKIKMSCILVLSSLFVSALFGLWQQQLVAFIDCLFIIGMITIVIGAWLYILDQGFFRVLNFGFKKLRKHLPFISKIRESDEVTNNEETTIFDYETKQYTYTKPIILSGCISVVISYTCLFLV